ncbi:hypothetical protein NQZ68_009969 [Dissostichus eleginoides]|nr:hypothetical protein NQZ68_009969 [Dissostichus eleginoides]
MLLTLPTLLFPFSKGLKMPSGYVKSDMERLGVFKEMSYISVGDKYTPPHSRKPDGATLIVVADLVLEVVTSLTKAILAAFMGMKTSVSEESIRSSLGDALSQSIAQALDVTSQVEDDSMELCAAVISKEVAESVNSAPRCKLLSASFPPPPPQDQRYEECSLEIANTAEGITALLNQQEENQERTNVGKSTSQQKQKTKCKQGVKLRLKNCLAKRFAKAWIHRMVVKLKNKFHPDPKAETTKSMMSLMSGVHANMYAEIRDQAWRFVTLMSWFVNTQVGTQSQRVQQAMMGPEAPFQSEALVERGEALERAALCEERTANPLEDANRQRDLNRVCVQIYVETTGDIIKSLFDRVWAEVQQLDFYTTPTTFADLDKIVYQRLCKNAGSPDMVLALFILKDPRLGSCIVWSVDHHLLNPPQKNRTICRFLRSVGKAISNIWGSVQ